MKPSMVALFAVSALLACRSAQAQSFDPNALRDPSALCRVLDRIQPANFHHWNQSRSTPGGYVCAPLGASRDVGPAGPRGATTINAFVYGSGPRKLDRATFKTNLFNPATADAGKDALIAMARALAEEMRIALPSGLEAAVRAQRVEIRNSVPPGPPRVVFSGRSGPMVVEAARGQGRVTSILIHFRNPDASDLWD